VPHAPQLAAFVFRSISQPFSGALSQLAVPGAHWQVPSWQVAPSGQRMPQLPQ
jgi:hypothetical protein